MQHAGRRFPPVTVPVQKDGWLSPEGVYYPCGYYHHDEAAMEIAGVGSYDLVQRGWVHISSGCIDVERELTQPQIDHLFDMYQVNPESFLAMRIAAMLHDAEREQVDGSPRSAW